ncbi:MAG: class I SAM-dependent methyltransferase [Actinomycetales bacterium]|nr:class I SAM-dependent methyltransferase [Actinomycetales bacterium]
MTKERAYLDYYSAVDIIPTRLDVSEDRLFIQRDHLLASCGISPWGIRGRDVIEVGTGTGQKARHILARSPRSYTAIDMNPASLSATSQAVEPWQGSVDISVLTLDVSSSPVPRDADLVIAECVIPLQLEPAPFLSRLAEAVRPGGILLITTADAISTLSEIMRRTLARQLGLLDGEPLSAAAAVAEFFAEDRRHLTGMTRLPVDWALDQIVHPWSGRLFGMDEAIDALPDFAPLGSSPRLCGSYAWYKECESFPDTLRNHWRESYWSHAHNLVDRRLPITTRDGGRNRELRQLSDQVYALEAAPLAQLSDVLDELATNLAEIAAPTLSSLTAARTAIDSGDPTSLAPMRPWWGYGTQYIAFTRIAA